MSSESGDDDLSSSPSGSNSRTSSQIRGSGGESIDRLGNVPVDAAAFDGGYEDLATTDSDDHLSYQNREPSVRSIDLTHVPVIRHIHRTYHPTINGQFFVSTVAQIYIYFY